MKAMGKAGVVVVALGAILGLAAPAQADNTTNGQDSTVGGNQVLVPINVGIDVEGNGVGVAGVGEGVGE